MSKTRGGTTAIALNGSGGAFISILATMTSRHVVFLEDPSMDPAAGGAGYQGFQYIDQTGSTIPVPPGGRVELGLTSGVQGSGNTPIQGTIQQGTLGYDGYRAAKVYLQAKSLTATPTKLYVLEED